MGNAMGSVLLFLVCVLLPFVGLYGWWKWIEMFNSEDGERYRRQIMQGPFAPLTEEDQREDEHRRHENQAGRTG